jgi:hypothetical protein
MLFTVTVAAPTGAPVGSSTLPEMLAVVCAKVMDAAIVKRTRKVFIFT